jgi:hypothetical protein
MRMHSLSARQEDLAACLAAAAEVVQFHVKSAGPRAQERIGVPQVGGGAGSGRGRAVAPAQLLSFCCRAGSLVLGGVTHSQGCS